MKNIVTLFGIAALLTSLNACQKEEQDDTASKGVPATIEVSLEGVKDAWKKGDKFTLFAEDGSSVVATLSKSGKKANFKAAKIAKGKLLGVWPENSASVEGGKLLANLPTAQEYGTDYFILVGAGNKEGMTFTTPYSALKVKVSGSCVVSSIEVTASSPIAGDVVIENGAATASADKKVTLSGINATVSGDAAFALAIAPGTYSTLTVALHDADANTKEVTLQNVTVAAGAATEAELSHTAPINLSAAGYANCYVVPGEGEYKFEAKKVDGTKVTGQAVAYVWTDVEYEYNEITGYADGDGNPVVGKEIKGRKGTPDPEWIVKNIAYDKTAGTISFTATGHKGNALIALYNESGEDPEVVWSWHIWSTGRTLEQMTVNDWETKNLLLSSAKQSWLDVNMGAIEAEDWNSSEIYGLLYQWGRKDPFPGAGKLGSQTTAAIDTGKVPFGDGSMPIYVNPIFGLGFSYCTELVSMDDAAKFPLKYYNTSNYWCTNPDDVNWGDGYQKFTSDYIAPYLTDQDPTWNYTDGPRAAEFAKSNNDPCPAGYRVPTIEQIVLSFAMWVADASTVGGVVYNFTEHWGDNHGSARSPITYTRRISSYTDESKTMLYPCSGYREAGGWLNNAGKSNYYPSATRKTNSNTYYRTIVGTNTRVDTSAGSYSIARNIRCVKAD